MPESIPKYRPGAEITCHASAALTGGRMVAISGAPTGGNPTVGVPAAGARVFGVAAQDSASGAKVGVHVAPGQVVPIEAGATLAPNDIVESNASGQAIVRAAGVACGVVVEGATSGNQALVLWRPANL